MWRRAGGPPGGGEGKAALADARLWRSCTTPPLHCAVHLKRPLRKKAGSLNCGWPFWGRMAGMAGMAEGWRGRVEREGGEGGWRGRGKRMQSGLSGHAGACRSRFGQDPRSGSGQASGAADRGLQAAFGAALTAAGRHFRAVRHGRPERWMGGRMREQPLAAWGGGERSLPTPRLGDRTAWLTVRATERAVNCQLP